MPQLVPVFLFLHVLGAIVAFGPSFAFPIIGGMGGKEPMHGNFALRVTEKIERGIVVPLAVVQGITGVGLIWSAGINPTTNLWLGLGIILYLIALSYAIFVQIGAVEHVIALTTMPAGGPPPGAPAGPPAGLAEAIQKVQRGGILLTVLIVAIVFLMVVKPTI